MSDKDLIGLEAHSSKMDGNGGAWMAYAEMILIGLLNSFLITDYIRSFQPFFVYIFTFFPKICPQKHLIVNVSVVIQRVKLHLVQVVKYFDVVCKMPVLATRKILMRQG